MTRKNEAITLHPARIRQTLEELEETGNPYHGTRGEARCRDYLAEPFDPVGLENTRLEAFGYLAYEKKSCACRVVSPEAGFLECRPVQFSVAGEAEGEAIYLGTAQAADFERIDRLGIDLAGRVVVAQSIAPFLVTPLLAGRGVADHGCQLGERNGYRRPAPRAARRCCSPSRRAQGTRPHPVRPGLPAGRGRHRVRLSLPERSRS